MEKRLVVCTSTGSLEYAPERYRNLGIEILRLTVNFEGVEYVEGLNLDPDEFYKKLETLKDPKNNLPRTSMASASEVTKTLEKAIENGYSEVIVITLSAYLSGSCDVVKTVSQNYKDKLKVTVINSKTCAFCEGYLAVKAKQLVDKGVDTQTIVKELNWIIDRQEFVGVDGKLDYLIYNGRLKGGKALIGKMMNICPLVGFDKEGVLGSIQSVRTPKKALNKMCEYIKEKIGNRSENDYLLFHVYTGPSLLNELKEIEKVHDIKVNHEDVIMAPVCGASNGPWLAGYGLMFIRRKDEPLD